MAEPVGSLQVIAEFGQIYGAMHTVRDAVKRVEHLVGCHMEQGDVDDLTRMGNIANRLISRVMADNDKVVESLQQTAERS